MPDLHALIIEDNTNDAGVLKNLLTKLEISHDTLFDSRTFAQDLTNVKRPDIIFLDLEIPGTSGYEVLSIIRGIANFAGIPVVAYTANSAQMHDARAAGFHSFLGKPLRSANFPALLERILNDDPVWEVR
jgi:CheY-like chemotaxis protein